MTRDSRIRLHASAWRCIDESSAPSEAIDKAEKLVDLARLVDLGKLSDASEINRQTVSRQFLELSEAVCTALKQLDVEARELRDGVKQLHQARDELRDRLGEAKYELKEFHSLQCQCKSLTRQLSASGQELTQFKEECCGLNKRCAALHAAFTELREQRDDLLDELARTPGETSVKEKPRVSDDAKHARFLFPDEHPDKIKFGRGLTTLGTYRPLADTQQELRLAGPLRDFGYNHCLHPVIALGKHLAMMLVFHHGFVAHGAAHATSTVMHHGITAGSAAASNPGVGGGVTALRHVGNSIFHQGTHSLIQRSGAEESDSKVSWTTQSRQRKARARDARDVARGVKVLNFLPADDMKETRDKTKRYSAGRPILQIGNRTCTNLPIEDVGC